MVFFYYCYEVGDVFGGFGWGGVEVVDIVVVEDVDVGGVIDCVMVWGKGDGWFGGGGVRCIYFVGDWLRLDEYVLIDGW